MSACLIPTEDGMHTLPEILVSALVNILGTDPAIQAMCDANDRDHFIEGLQADVTFPAKMTAALLDIAAVIASDEFAELAA